MKKNPVLFYKKISLALFFFCLTLVSRAQLLDSLSLDAATTYTNVQEALKEPDKVYKLVLRRQHLKSFPKDILKLTKLQYLDLSKNSISELPDSIYVLTDLQYFACSKTGLKSLPKEIGKLQNLLYLNFNQNDLQYLPPQIGNLEKLQVLDLWSNSFDGYPTTLSGLKSLRVIDLRNILINEEMQANLKSQMPHATVHMSPSCKCKW
jgi:leucine-rich repeat protein SHOC2